ncbi:PRC-barrel domain-containing protein [Caenispirillum bisanense]|uniref:Sporulation protein YlmC, PRC-barrel domain family n=1 Tax=Caenispirillum bisanense TaxID=414052 RepID=A0A286G621_9PROT|nr:PRC-barrel domain-containing protein [Caenispirillum bisanense]SOD90991.1 Sporulation protein YlmC, PRC-barrel domain family [Caenispirillum bisanense]
MLRHTIGASTLALAVALAGPAVAQSQNQSQTQGQTGQQQMQKGQANVQGQQVRVLSEWNYDELYRTGLRAENLLDADVMGPQGEEIGSVENVILDQNNQIVALIAQVGGFWDIGDTHVAVPWTEAKLVDDGVQIPVTEENAEDYDLYAETSVVNKQMLQQARVVDDDLTAGSRVWKLTNLIDDFATLRGGVGYGYVDDAIFTREGKLQAVVVEPSGTGYGVGPYAYPFYGYGAGTGWNAGLDTYEMPYGEGDVAEMETLDYDLFEDDWGEID